MTMQPSYLAGYLQERQIDCAYALVASFAPEVRLAQWRGFCRQALPPLELDGRDTLAVVNDARGYLRGICVFAARIDAAGTRVLDVPLFAPFSVDARGAARELLAFLSDAADRLHCSTI